MEIEVLYNDSNFRVEINPKEEMGHWLYIKSVGNPELRYSLQRGVLDELSRVRPNELSDKLNSVNSLIPVFLMHNEMPVERLGYVLAQARIKELKDEASYFVREMFRAEFQRG